MPAIVPASAAAIDPLIAAARHRNLTTVAPSIQRRDECARPLREGRKGEPASSGGRNRFDPSDIRSKVAHSGDENRIRTPKSLTRQGAWPK